MSEVRNVKFPAIRPEAAFVAAQNSAACWSRAFSHLTEGLMAAAKTQAALASEVFKVEPNGWLKPATSGNAAEITHEWLASHRARQEKLLHGFRQINDDLTACLFTAANDLADGLNFENAKAEAPSAAARSAAKTAGPAKGQVAA